jgi:hypothetical protein
MSFGSSSPGGSPDGIGGNEGGIGSASDGGGGRSAIDSFLSPVGQFIERTQNTIGKFFSATGEYLDKAASTFIGHAVGEIARPVTTVLDVITGTNDFSKAAQELGNDLGHLTFSALTDNVIAPGANALGIGYSHYGVSDSQGNVFQPGPIMKLAGINESSRLGKAMRDVSPKSETNKKKGVKAVGSRGVHASRLYRGNATKAAKRVVYK